MTRNNNILYFQFHVFNISTYYRSNFCCTDRFYINDYEESKKSPIEIVFLLVIKNCLYEFFIGRFFASFVCIGSSISESIWAWNVVVWISKWAFAASSYVSLIIDYSCHLSLVPWLWVSELKVVQDTNIFVIFCPYSDVVVSTRISSFRQLSLKFFDFPWTPLSANK